MRSADDTFIPVGWMFHVKLAPESRLLHMQEGIA